MKDQTTTSAVAALIGAGHDREAARLGATQATRTSEVSMQPLDQFDALGPHLGAVVGGIRAEHLDRPTPCSEFTVRGILEHMLGGASTFAEAYGGTAPAASSDPVADVLAALGALGTAVHQPGALDRAIDAPFGSTAGDDFLRFVVLDGLVHGWDLTRATGQDYDPPAALVATVTDYAASMVPTLAGSGAFADPVPTGPDASELEHLVAYCGRRVA